jgi:hypothetical protein
MLQAEIFEPSSIQALKGGERGVPLLHYSCKEERSMFKRVMICCCLSALCLVLAAGFTSAQDTSPYLAGAWNEERNWVTIINPTTKPLTVYAVLYSDGVPVLCQRADIRPNGLIGGYAGLPDAFGTMKFFAFPQGTMKFDPNAVIGGFQGKDWWHPFGLVSSEANLKAVTINSYTIREFSMIPPYDHPCWTVALALPG